MQVGRGLFVVSATFSIACMAMFLVHCYRTRHTQQRYLLASQSALMMSLLLSTVYMWHMPLQRYRNIVSAILTAASIAFLVQGMITNQAGS